MQLWRVPHIIVTSRMFPIITITHLECFPIFSVINYVQKNSLNTVKFNLPGSDIVWCENLMLMLLSSTVKYFSYPARVIQVKV